MRYLAILGLLVSVPVTAQQVEYVAPNAAIEVQDAGFMAHVVKGDPPVRTVQDCPTCPPGGVCPVQSPPVQAAPRAIYQEPAIVAQSAPVVVAAPQVEIPMETVTEYRYKTVKVPVTYTRPARAVPVNTYSSAPAARATGCTGRTVQMQQAPRDWTYSQAPTYSRTVTAERPRLFNGRLRTKLRQCLVARFIRNRLGNRSVSRTRTSYAAPVQNYGLGESGYSARWTYPGNLDNHMAGWPHNVNTTGWSHSAKLRQHDADHDRIGAVSGRQLAVMNSGRR